VFGAEAWIGVRFDHIGWRFLLAENLVKTKGDNFVASFDFLEKNGMKFEELIGKFKQERLF
jgi:Holliday junction resolvase